MVGTSKSGNRGPKDNTVSLHLAAELRLALAKIQIKMNLDRTYAALQAFILGCYDLEAISEEEYEFFKKHYGAPPIPTIQKPQKAITPKELMEDQKLLSKDHWFKDVLEAWDRKHKDQKWLDFVLKEAEKWKDKLDSAKLVSARTNK